MLISRAAKRSGVILCSQSPMPVKRIEEFFYVKGRGKKLLMLKLCHFYRIIILPS